MASMSMRHIYTIELTTAEYNLVSKALRRVLEPDEYEAGEQLQLQLMEQKNKMLQSMAGQATRSMQHIEASKNPKPKEG